MKRRILSAVAGLTSATLLSGCGFHGLYSTPLPGGADLGSHPFHITVEFTDVLDLVPQSSVKVNDVAVGKVDKISLDGWTAKVDLTVNGDVDLPSNARAEIRQTSLLGEKYVELEQPAAPDSGRLGDGANIEIRRTGRNPEVEEILGAISLVLSGGGLAQVQTIMHEMNNIFNGRTDKIKDLFGQLTTFVGALDSQKAAILQAIDQVDALSAHLNQQKQAITDTLDTMPSALSVLSSERDDFVGLLNSLSNFGSVATTVMNQSNNNLIANFKSLQPTLTELNKGASNLPKALDVLATAPFPGAVTQALKGDYISVSLHYPGLCLPDITNPNGAYNTCNGRGAKPSNLAAPIPGVTG
jgi:phospholipid/cholesterol/gamma-HCH transport system substrate-binding protein